MLLAHDAGTWEDPLVEGPSMALVNGKHHLFYGAGWWESDRAAIGYATCPGPMGGCTKRMPPAAWMATDVAKAGPAGPMLFSPDGGATWRVAYHAWKPGQVGYAFGAPGPVDRHRRLLLRRPGGAVSGSSDARLLGPGWYLRRPHRGGGGIGRRASLRGWCPQGRGGSSPPHRTGRPARTGRPSTLVLPASGGDSP